MKTKTNLSESSVNKYVNSVSNMRLDLIRMRNVDIFNSLNQDQENLEKLLDIWLTENLEKEVLEKHFNNNSDELIFLGGFIGPEPVSELSETLNEPSTCKIIYGCYKAQGIDPLIHKKYQKITTNSVT